MQRLLYASCLCSGRLGLWPTSWLLNFLSILINNMSQFRQASWIIICQARSPKPNLAYSHIRLSTSYLSFSVWSPHILLSSRYFCLGAVIIPWEVANLNFLSFPKVFHSSYCDRLCSLACWRGESWQPRGLHWDTPKAGFHHISYPQLLAPLTLVLVFSVIGLGCSIFSWQWELPNHRFVSTIWKL